MADPRPEVAGKLADWLRARGEEVPVEVLDSTQMATLMAEQDVVLSF